MESLTPDQRAHARKDYEAYMKARPKIILISIIVALIIACCPTPVIGWVTQREVVGTFETTQVINGNTYLVILEDGETEASVYGNFGSWFFLKWKSQELLANLVPGQRYMFRVYGIRIPAMYWFPNVVSATPR